MRQAWWGIVAALGLGLSLPVVGQAGLASAAEAPSLNPGKTSVFWGEDGFRHARHRQTRYDPRALGVRLMDGPQGGYLPEGVVELGELSFPAFDRAVISWNADCPAGTFVILEAAWRMENDELSPFLELARWGDPALTREPAKELRAKRTEGARVNEDTLELAKPSGRLMLRATLRTTRPDQSPLLSLLAAATVRKDRSWSPSDERGPAWGQALQAPPRSQSAERADLSYRVCGPTSASMALAGFGVSLPVAEVAERCWDELNGIYGNWPFLAAGMSQLLRQHQELLPAKPGRTKAFQSFVHFAPDWKDVEAEVARGNVAIASIHYGPHELSGSPTVASDGHLVLVRGFTAQGDVVVNDPAGRTPSMVHRVYRRAELHRARHGGPVIVLRPFAP